MNIYKAIIEKWRGVIKTLKQRRLIKKYGGIVIGKVILRTNGNFIFGRNVILSGRGIDNNAGTQIYVAHEALLTIGNFSGLTQSSIYCMDRIEIGDYVKIGAGCLIFDSNFHNTDWNIRREPQIDVFTAITKPVKICSHAFIGARTIITKGVTIGERSIIAAGSIVVTDIPSDCIAGGNPCKIIKRINQC